MKKYFIMSLLMLLTTSVVKAQNESKWSVNLRTGFNLADMVGDDAKDEKSGIGFVIGTEAEWNLNKWISLYGGLQYVRLNGKCDEQYKVIGENYEYTYEDEKYMREYIQVPILFGFHPLKGLTLKAGIQPGWRISSRMKVFEEGWHDSGNGKEYYTFKNYMGINAQTRQFAFDIPVGASYEYHNVILDARYHFALNKYFKEVMDMRNSYLTITLGYKFNM